MSVIPLTIPCHLFYTALLIHSFLTDKEGPWHKTLTRNDAFFVSLKTTFTLGMIGTYPAPGPTQWSTPPDFW